MGKGEFVLPAQKCPSCNCETLQIRGKIKSIPHFGETLMTLAVCGNCGFRHSDVMSLGGHKPVLYELEISSGEDLKGRIIKSGTCTVKIPTLGVVIEPGPASDGFISNVEGVLNRVERAINLTIKNAAGEQVRRGKLKLKKLHRILDGRSKAKIVIIDPFGNSAIIHKKAKRRELKT